jgi:hypothetical protein
MKMKEYKITPEYFDENTISSYQIKVFVNDNSIKVPFSIQCEEYPQGLWIGDINKSFGACDCCCEIYSLKGDVLIFELVEE